MKNTLTGILSMLICSLTFGQSFEGKLTDKVVIIKADTLKKGIYKSLYEFQLNNPSIKTDFKFGNMFEPLDYKPNTQLRKYYLYIESNNQYARFKEKHWGICDGENVYVLFKGKYLKLSRIGKYSTFTNVTNNNQFTYGYSLYDNDYLLNVLDGKIVRYNEMNLQTILRSEKSPLLKEFLADTDRRNNLYNYLLRLNKSILN